MPETAAKPNILIAVADDWSFGHAGAYGCQWVKTPNFDKVAKEGILFTNTYTPNAKCAPSRAALLTGRNSWQLEGAGNHQGVFPTKFKTYPEALAEVGYRIGYTAKGWAPGVAFNIDGSPRELLGKEYSDRLLDPPTPDISNINYTANFQAFLDDSVGKKPWCFWYGSKEPHRGYNFRSGVRLGGKSLHDIDRIPQYWPDTENVRHDLLDYALEVEHFDRQLGLMIQTLVQRGELENTLLIAFSDNGMPFPRVKGQGYDHSNHLPMAIRWGHGIAKPGRIVADFISFIDLASTIIEAAHLDWEESGLSPTPGKSLMPLFQSEKEGEIDPDRNRVLIGKEKHDVGRPGNVGYPIRGIVTESHLYLKNFKPQRWPAGNPETGYLNCDGSPTKTEILKLRTDPEKALFWTLSFGKRPEEELYDLQADPDCMRNLANDPSYSKIKDGLRHQLIAELIEQGDPRFVGDNPDIFDTYPIFEERWENFHERYLKGEAPVSRWIRPTDPDPSFIETEGSQAETH